jgi:hypothetical protein
MQMVVKPIVKLSELAGCNGSKGFGPFLAAIRERTLCLDAVLKAHLRRDQLRGRGLDGIKVIGRPRRAAQIAARMNRGSRERKMRRLRSSQLYSAGLTRVGIEALLGVR